MNTRPDERPIPSPKSEENTSSKLSSQEIIDFTKERRTSSSSDATSLLDQYNKDLRAQATDLNEYGWMTNLLILKVRVRSQEMADLIRWVE